MKTACALAFALATLFTAPLARAQDEIASSVAGVDINNFHQVSAGVYRSGRPTPEQLLELAPLGVRTVLSLESYMLDGDDGTDEAAAAAQDGLSFLRDEMSPLPWNEPTLAQIEDALAIITNPANQPVLVHCYHGSDRTGLVIGAYHIRVDHWTADQAIADMKNYGHSPLFYGWDQLLYQIH